MVDLAVFLVTPSTVEVLSVEMVKEVVMSGRGAAPPLLVTPFDRVDFVLALALETLATLASDAAPAIAESNATAGVAAADAEEDL